jgi:hypothetical protein
VIDMRKATDIASRLTALPFFPPAIEEDARAEIVLMACKIAGDLERLEWLVSHALELWDKWYGLRELRFLFSSRYRPADGIEGATGSVIPAYEDGYPPETPRGKGMIVGKPQEFLPPGEISRSERDAIDLLDEAIARKAALKRAATPTDEEIKRLLEEQEARQKDSKAKAEEELRRILEERAALRRSKGN